MQYSELARYAKIGWDFDKTLIDNPRAAILYRFILEHPAIEHSIITFRSHGMQDGVYDELRSAGGPSPQHFKRLLNISDRAWEADQRAEYQRRAGVLYGEPTPAEIYYRLWKGLTCAQHGIGVLVDDDTLKCAPGCARYAVLLVHPDEITPD